MQVDVTNMGLIPGLERSPGEGNGNSLQCSCLENPMDGGAWWAMIHRVLKSQTRLSMHIAVSGRKPKKAESLDPAFCSWAAKPDSNSNLSNSKTILFSRSP